VDLGTIKCSGQYLCGKSVQQICKKALNPKNNVVCSCYDMKLMLCEKMVLCVYVKNKTIMNLLP
jgi:hypothetical protein